MALGNLQCIKKVYNIHKNLQEFNNDVQSLIKNTKYKIDYNTCKYLNGIILEDILKC